MRNPTCGIQKPNKVTSASKYLETGIISLLAADNQNIECASANLLEDLFNKSWIFLIKYPLQISVTMDPESSNDGTCQPSKSIGTAGHCETALCITLCFTSKLTAWLVSVQINSLYLLAGIGDNIESTTAPFP